MSNNYTHFWPKYNIASFWWEQVYSIYTYTGTGINIQLISGFWFLYFTHCEVMSKSFVQVKFSDTYTHTQIWIHHCSNHSWLTNIQMSFLVSQNLIYLLLLFVTMTILAMMLWSHCKKLGSVFKLYD